MQSILHIPSSPPPPHTESSRSTALTGARPCLVGAADRSESVSAVWLRRFQPFHDAQVNRAFSDQRDWRGSGRPPPPLPRLPTSAPCSSPSFLRDGGCSRPGVCDTGIGASLEGEGFVHALRAKGLASRVVRKERRQGGPPPPNRVDRLCFLGGKESWAGQGVGGGGRVDWRE